MDVASLSANLLHTVGAKAQAVFTRMGKIALVVCGLFFGFSLSVFADDATQQKLLVGTWQCHMNQDQGETKLSIDTAESYHTNGTASSTGILSIRVPAAGVSASYSVVGQSTWRIKDGLLKSELTDIRVLNQSNPRLDELFHMEEALKTQDPHSISTITNLTKNKLVLEEVNKKTVMTCSR